MKSDMRTLCLTVACFAVANATLFFGGDGGHSVGGRAGDIGPLDRRYGKWYGHHGLSLPDTSLGYGKGYGRVGLGHGAFDRYESGLSGGMVSVGYGSYGNIYGKGKYKPAREQYSFLFDGPRMGLAAASMGYGKGYGNYYGRISVYGHGGFANKQVMSNGKGPGGYRDMGYGTRKYGEPLRKNSYGPNSMVYGGLVRRNNKYNVYRGYNVYPVFRGYNKYPVFRSYSKYPVFRSQTGYKGFDHMVY